MASNNKRHPIVQIIDSLALGGAENVAVDIANRLNQDIFESHLIVTTKEGYRLNQLLPHVKYFYLAKRKRFDLNAMRRLISYMREKNIMIVHTHQQTGACLCSIASQLFRWNCIHIHSDHNPLQEDWDEQKIIKRFLMRNVHHYFPVSQQMADWERKYLHVPERKQQVLWNGVDTANFKPSEKAGYNTIVQIAGLRPQKCIQTAIDTAKLLISKGLKFSWLVAGPWDNPPTLEQKKLLEEAAKPPLSEYFRFLGPVLKIHELLFNSGIGVLTSKSEAMPVVLCEYLAAGLPVVVSDISIHREVIDGNDCGLFAEVGNPSDFAAKIAWLLNNPKEAKVMGGNARVLACARLDINKQIQSLEQKYEELLKKAN